MFLITAFLLGFLGSFHCAGMCGPIAIALPVGKSSWINRLIGVLTYNIGRGLTYMVMGGIIGLLGMGISMAGFQQWASIIAGSVMILFVIVPMIFSRTKGNGGIFEKLTSFLQRKLSPLFKNASYKSLFTIGLLNGILPCGLVYVALAGALNMHGVISSMLFMGAFALGTFPIMSALAVTGSFLSLKVRTLINKISPYIIILLGILFILRGLSLGIPYVSPKSEALTPVVEKAHSCCKPK
jgi:uncharacterized protein